VDPELPDPDAGFGWLCFGHPSERRAFAREVAGDFLLQNEYSISCASAFQHGNSLGGGHVLRTDTAMPSSRNAQRETAPSVRAADGGDARGREPVLYGQAAASFRRDVRGL